MKRLSAIILTAVAAAACLPAFAQQGKAKYIFYFIGDGMGMGHVNTAETYSRDVLHASRPMLMLTFPTAGQVRTYSANSPITDSAAAGTALSTGHKTNNYMVGMAPDTTDVYSISRDFMQAGWPVGIVTSVAGDDATPAAFYAHAAGRSQKELISSQAITSGISFLGAPTFRGLTDKDGKPTGWEQRMANEGGYTVVYDAAGFDANRARTGNLLMLASQPQGDQAGYTIDSIAGAITVQQLTGACLAHLEAVAAANGAPGFFMMSEGGNIDWAAHANDGAAVVKEILNYQKAIDVAYQFYLRHPDETLIVITADHDTGGMALGRIDNPKKPRLDLIDFQKISKERFTDWCKARHTDGKPLEWDEIKQFMNENLGLWGAIQPTADEEKAIKEAFDKSYRRPGARDEKTLYKDFSHFTVVVYDILNRHYGIGFTSPSHTANFVPVYAIGAGHELFGRNLNNTEIPGLILRASAIGANASETR